MTERAEGWDRAIRDIKARFDTIGPDETALTWRTINEVLDVVERLENPYREEHDGTAEWEFQDCSTCGGARCPDAALITEMKERDPTEVEG